jgi:hypothetical protein
MTVPTVTPQEIGLASLLGNASMVLHDDGSIEFLAAGAATINGASIGTGTGNPIATARLLGNISGVTAAPSALTAAQVRTLLALAAIATSGSGADLSANTVANAKLAAVSTATFKGRVTAGSGDVEDLTAAQVRTALALAAIATSGSGADLGTGTVPLTAVATEADQTVLGNVSGGAASPIALSVAQLRTLIAVFGSAVTGLVPASGGGTTNFLRADGSWTTPPAGGTASEGCLVGLTADATLTADNTLRTIAWTAEAYDDGYHAANAATIVIPAGKGGAGTRFRVDAGLSYDASVGGGIIQWILRHNASRVVGGYDGPASQASDNAQYQGISYIFDAPADGDTFDVVYGKNGTNSTLNHTFDGVAGEYTSFFSITKIK